MKFPAANRRRVWRWAYLSQKIVESSWRFCGRDDWNWMWRCAEGNARCQTRRITLSHKPRAILCMLNRRTFWRQKLTNCDICYCACCAMQMVSRSRKRRAARWPRRTWSEPTTRIFRNPAACDLNRAVVVQSNDAGCCALSSARELGFASAFYSPDGRGESSDGSILDIGIGSRMEASRTPPGKTRDCGNQPLISRQFLPIFANWNPTDGASRHVRMIRKKFYFTSFIARKKEKER